jgi:hypothetical protein
MRRRGFLGLLAGAIASRLLPPVPELFPLGKTESLAHRVTVDMTNEIMFYKPSATPLLAMTNRLKAQRPGPFKYDFVVDQNHVTWLLRAADPRLPAHYLK